MDTKRFLVWCWARDFAASKRFYGELLGLKNVVSDDDWAEYETGVAGTHFAIHGAPEKRIEPAMFTAVFYVADLTRTLESLAERGVHPVGKVMDVPGLHRLAKFDDPSGNRVCVGQILSS
jgi:predicted enzyme related to lactoylglutathione lyase